MSGGGAGSTYVGPGAAIAAGGAAAIGQQRQQQQGVGLAGLLADIVADDLVLLQQLQQRGLGQQQQ
jgi:hypothetical protein